MLVKSPKSRICDLYVHYGTTICIKSILVGLAPIAKLAGAEEYFKMPQDTGENGSLVNTVQVPRSDTTGCVEVLLPWQGAP